MTATIATSDSPTTRWTARSHRVTARRPDDRIITPLGPQLVAEFIGTLFLVLTVCMATNAKHGAGALAPLAIGAVLMVMVFARGHISGDHYNSVAIAQIRGPSPVVLSPPVCWREWRFDGLSR
jgi:glycerol uptake facilitator-like aquaporin